MQLKRNILFFIQSVFKVLNKYSEKNVFKNKSMFSREHVNMFSDYAE